MQRPASVTLFFCSSNSAASTCKKDPSHPCQPSPSDRTSSKITTEVGLRVLLSETPCWALERNFPMWKQQQSLFFFLWCEMLIKPEKPCSSQAPGQPEARPSPVSCQPHGLHGVPTPAVGPGSSGSSSTYICQVAAPARGEGSQGEHSRAQPPPGSQPQPPAWPHQTAPAQSVMDLAGPPFPSPACSPSPSPT